MAIIPDNQQFHTLAEGVDTENRGSATANSNRTMFTMADIEATIDGSHGDIGGSIDEYEIAIGSDTSDEIEGSSALTYDGSTMSITGAVTATGNISAVDVTATGVTATPTLSVTGGVVGSLRSAFVASPPSSAATAGTQGDILFDADAIYVCTATGIATEAAWKKVDITTV